MIVRYPNRSAGGRRPYSRWSGIFFLGFIARAIFAPLLPTMSKALNLSYGQAGSLFSHDLPGGVCGARPARAFLTAWLNHRKTIILSTVGLAVGLLAFYPASQQWQVRLLLMLIGAAAGMYLPSGIASITAMVAKHDWGKALGVHQPPRPRPWSWPRWLRPCFRLGVLADHPVGMGVLVLLARRPCGVSATWVDSPARPRLRPWCVRSPGGGPPGS